MNGGDELNNLCRLSYFFCLVKRKGIIAKSFDINMAERMNEILFQLLVLASIFISIRILFRLSYGACTNIVVVLILLYCIYESYLGLSQLLGYGQSNNRLYMMTASFENPGPFGGFLSVCISLFIPFLLINEPNTNTDLLYKVQYWLIVIGTVCAVIILPSTQSRSAIVALGCSFILFLVGNDKMRPVIKKVLKQYGIVILIGAVLLGVGAYQFKKPSADGRLFMDRICIKAMCTNGWKGAGIGNFGGVYGETQANYFKEQIEIYSSDGMSWRVINEHDRLTADCPENAFNEYLFIGVEAGPFAMLLFICIMVAAIMISFKKRTIWCYGVTAFAVFALFSYPLHVRQFQILLPVLIAGCISGGTERNGLIWLVSEVTVFAVLFTMIILKIPGHMEYKRAESAWKTVESWHSMGLYGYVVESCDTLLPYMNRNSVFLFAYGQSLNKTGNYEKSDSILKMGTESSSDPMFWNVMGNNGLALGRYREAEERYEHAFFMVPNRLYPLSLLAKLYHAEGDSVRFVEMAGIVESFVPKVESVSTESMRSEIRELKTSYLLLEK